MMTRDKRLTVALAVLPTLIWAVHGETIKVRVVSIRSGDMLTTLTSTNVDQEVKLAGVIAPSVSLRQPYSRRALKALSDKVLGKVVTVHHSRPDMMGQIVGRVMLGDRWINKEMLAEGAAWFDKTTSNSEELRETEKEARGKKTGLWSEGKPVPPWEWKDPNAAGAEEKWVERTAKNTDTVYVVEGSNKYHRKECRRVREKVRAVSRKRAEKWSYKPCTICKP